MYSSDDTPFATYLLTYWEPERTDELRCARRISGQWLDGVLDDAGGPGGRVEGPVVMRLASDGNPSVAYRVSVEDRNELRLAQWNPLSENWAIQVALPHSGDDFDFAFDAQGRPSIAYSGLGSTDDTRAVHYLLKDGGSWSDEIVSEWPRDEASLNLTRLSYDPLGRPLVISDNSKSSTYLWWLNEDTWDTYELVTDAYVTQSRIAVAENGTPYIAYSAYEDWEEGSREVVLVSYD